MENGFKAMSQTADMDNGGGGENDGGHAGGGSTADLKSVGVDANHITEAANERASELQQLIVEEIRARPMRALGWAAAAGVVLGFWAAK
ncbi:hypothetical protein [Bosea sp. PAMC 26642]|uniref:hypothetical protein n=1 Tax=Bosea sp. (strain PAMC 26642) TaxID=1792307 RepID=UPI00077027B5|nr:hypothetical protein [Bosea sp. PAMC 26642]AMJ61949.1 hypothetical protein AXW83_18060 [Bosea sp. PAMC 26642]